MCVGLKSEDSNLLRSSDLEQIGGFNQKRSDKRRENAKSAARERRSLEGDFFSQLEQLLPLSLSSSPQSSLDKTSVIRLSLAGLKCADLLSHGLQIPEVKTEVPVDLDIFSCLDAFTLVLGSNRDIIFVSENVSNYIGLSQDLADYVHPSDQQQLEKLLMKTQIFPRLKCTVTERGRLLNLRQAAFKPLKVSGKVRLTQGGVIFLGQAGPVLGREVVVEQTGGEEVTRHASDMNILHWPPGLETLTGHSRQAMLGLSFFQLIHGQDCEPVLKALSKLREVGQVESPVYRLLCGGGGWCWILTRAATVNNRKGQTVICTHHVLSEVQNKEEILSLIQMKDKSVSTFETNPVTETGLTCTPTSVIVKYVREPNPVTEDRFQPRTTTEPRPVTELLFSPIKAATEKGAEEKPMAENSDETFLEDDFFNELFSNLEELDNNLEMLAPHAGDNCISLSLPLIQNSLSEDKPENCLLNPGDNLMWANYEVPEKRHCSAEAEAGLSIRETWHHSNTDNDGGAIKIIIQDNLDEPPDQESLSGFHNELKNFVFA